MTDTVTLGRRVRRPRDGAPNTPIPGRLRVALVGERDPVLQLALICDHLRPRLLQAARGAGAGDAADDIVAEVVARRFRTVASNAPITLATPLAFNHLTASLLVSVRNAALTHRRDTSRVVLVASDELPILAGGDGAPPAHAAITGAEELHAVREALGDLSPRDAQIARLIGIHDMTIREVADRLGVGASTVHDTWRRVQRTIRAEVERVLTGEVCRLAAPHLALVASQHHCERNGDHDAPLSEVVGEGDARRLISHVFGGGDGAGGCLACRRALARQRRVLHHALPAPATGLGLSDAGDWTREMLTRLWSTATATAARASDAIWGLLGQNPVPGAGGIAATTVGIGSVKLTALIATAAIATSVPTVITTIDRSGSVHAPHGPVAAASRHAKTPSTSPSTLGVAATTSPSGRAAATVRRPSASAASAPTVSATASSTASAPSHSSGPTAEFTPGP